MYFDANFMYTLCIQSIQEQKLLTFCMKIIFYAEAVLSNFDLTYNFES